MCTEGMVSFATTHFTFLENILRKSVMREGHRSFLSRHVANCGKTVTRRQS